MCARAAMAIFRRSPEMHQRIYEPAFVTGPVAHGCRTNPPSQTKYPLLQRPTQQDRGRFGIQLRQSAPAYQQALLRSCARLDPGIGGLLLRSYSRNMSDRRRVPDAPLQDEAGVGGRDQGPAIKKPGFLSGFKKRVRWGTNTYVA